MPVFWLLLSAIVQIRSVTLPLLSLSFLCRPTRACLALLTSVLRAFVFSLSLSLSVSLSLSLWSCTFCLLGMQYANKTQPRIMLSYAGAISAWYTLRIRRRTRSTDYHGRTIVDSHVSLRCFVCQPAGFRIAFSSYWTTGGNLLFARCDCLSLSFLWAIYSIAGIHDLWFTSGRKSSYVWRTISCNEVVFR